MRIKHLGIPALLAAAALAAGCGGEDQQEPAAASGGKATANAEAAPASDGAAVTVKTFMFQPDPIEIEAGETVTWTNEDSAVHTVTLGPRDRPDGTFDEELSESGGTVQHTFDEPGTYRYFCSLHSGPGMEGTVVVR